MRGLKPAATEAPVFKDFAGGVVAGGARHSPAGMRARAAHIKAANGRAILGPTWHGSKEIKLVGTHLTVEDIPTRAFSLIALGGLAAFLSPSA
jgi:hypothetical protein